MMEMVKTKSEMPSELFDPSHTKMCRYRCGHFKHAHLLLKAQMYVKYIIIWIPPSLSQALQLSHSPMAN